MTSLSVDGNPTLPITTIPTVNCSHERSIETRAADPTYHHLLFQESVQRTRSKQRIPTPYS
jgi:hypothetical protein